MVERLNKRDWLLLGRIFEAEIDGLLPFQSKARGYERLAERGMVTQATRRFGRDRFGSIEVTGWVLTPRGHILYCAECERYAPMDGEDDAARATAGGERDG